MHRFANEWNSKVNEMIDTFNSTNESETNKGNISLQSIEGMDIEINNNSDNNQASLI